MRRVILGIVFIWVSLPALAADEMTLGLLMTPHQRSAYAEVLDRFSAESGIEVNMLAYTDQTYKHYLEQWLQGQGDCPDVLYWQASQRLFSLAQRGELVAVTDLWEELELDRPFAHIKDLVTYQREVYGLPYSYYHWGLYYKKSLLEKYGDAPQNWEEFLAVCAAMKADGIAPLGLGNRNHWPVAAWFDYLNLRINGLAFHRKLLRGEVSFYDTHVRKVLVAWKTLIDQGFYNKNSRMLTWDEVLPYLYRDKLGFTLIGNFVSNKIPQNLRSQIGFMPFPRIADIPRYEEAPLEIFMIPKRGKKIQEARRFLSFIARSDVQTRLNQALGYQSPHLEGRAGQDYFLQQGEKLLKSAYGVSQFFDRDTLPEFEKRVLPMFSSFVRSGDIETLIEQLEQARLDVWNLEDVP